MSNLTNGGGIMVANVRSLNRRRRSVSAVLVIALVFRFLAVGVTALPLDEFYPFNNNTDDRTEAKDDGGSPAINLTVPFPFIGNQEYFTIYVNNNGIISFRDKLHSYKPINFSSNDFADVEKAPCVAPYWSDVDIENVKVGGFYEAVLYRVTNATDVAARASQDVLEYFQATFTPAEIVIATWYNVGYYGATGRGKYKRNFFQSVLITDGSSSYVIFNYNRTEWTTGANSRGDPNTGLGGNPAVVGFYSGNRTLYYLVPDSGTDAILNITHKSNIRKPGKFIFRVDGETVGDPPCRGSEFLTLEPKNIPMLGRRPLIVRGPCLIAGQSVRARIKELGLEFDCQMVDTNTSVCVTPSIFRTGEVTLEYDPDGTNDWRFPTVLYVDHISEPNSPQYLIRNKTDDWQPGRMVTVQWNETGVGASVDQSKTLEVLAYSYNESVASFVQIQSVDVAAGESSRKFKLVSDFTNYSTLITRLCWTVSSLRTTSPVCIWSDVFPVRWKSTKSAESEEWCGRWLAREAGLQRVKVTKQSCPCTLNIAENDSGHFQADPYCDNKRQSSNSLNCVYNVNAKKCLRKNLRSSILKGETCCYDSDGELMDIRESPGAGTHQRYHYKAQGDGVVPYFSYYESDVLPRLHCCQFSSKNCSDFIALRNATTCSGYSPPSPAQAAGDPHIVTLDGKNYSFNGVGDFYLVKDALSTFIVQVEATPAIDANGTRQNATVFTKVAVQMPGASDTIEITKGGSGAEILVNSVTLTSSTLQFRNISLSTNDDGSYLVVLEPISVSLTIYVTPDLLNIIILIGEESLKGNLSGLLGNYNGNAEDDFIARNGTALPGDSSMRDIHYDFGMTWLVPASESIFSTSYDSSVSDAINYEPVFIDDIPISPEAEATCGGNMPCRFDLTVTKKESIARSTLEVTNKFESLKEIIEEKVVRCEYIDVPPNGNRTVSGYSGIGSIVTFTCDPGYEMLLGTPKRVCQEDGQWSGADVKCVLRTVDEENNSLKTTIAIVVTCSSVIFLILVISAVYCVRKRRKRKPKIEVEIPLSILNIPVFENPVFMQNLQGLVREGGFHIPRPNYVDPNIYQEYF